LKWTEGTNVQIDVRWGNGDGERVRSFTSELVQLAPDVILGVNTAPVRALKQATRTVPCNCRDSRCAIGCCEDIFPIRYHALDGGMISYGPDFIDLHRQAAAYVDRILKGAKPSDLPVQTPTKFELVVNLKTAKALGFSMPPTLLAHVDEVIE